MKTAPSSLAGFACWTAVVLASNIALSGADVPLGGDARVRQFSFQAIPNIQTAHNGHGGEEDEYFRKKKHHGGVQTG